MIMSTHQIKSNQRQPIISQTEDITIFMEINDKMTLWTQVNTPKETEKS